MMTFYKVLGPNEDTKALIKDSIKDLMKVTVVIKGLHDEEAADGEEE